MLKICCSIVVEGVSRCSFLDFTTKIKYKRHTLAAVFTLYFDCWGIPLFAGQSLTMVGSDWFIGSRFRFRQLHSTSSTHIFHRACATLRCRTCENLSFISSSRKKSITKYVTSITGKAYTSCSKPLGAKRSFFPL